MIALIIPFLLQSGVTPGVYQPALPERPATDARRKTGQKPPGSDQSARFEACIDQALDDPASAIVTASEWHVAGGGWLAMQCQGFAQSELGQFAQASTSFAEAADTAASAKSPETPRLWAQAGNAALAAGDGAAALSAFDQSLSFTKLATSDDPATARDRGLIYVDRARALVVMGKLDAAKADLETAQKLVPEDGLVWLLSATLARRSGDLARAQAHLDTAAKLAPKDPAVALEAGNIAVLRGRDDAARKSWQSVITLAPDSAEATSAKAYLAQLDAALQE